MTEHTLHETAAGERFRIADAAHIGQTHYTVASLDRMIAFYRDRLGFRVHWRKDSSAGLGAGGADLLRLTQLDGARRVRRTTGLYHTAFLVPTRWELARLLWQIVQTQTPVQGFSNHGTHLAIYLPDAEGNGIELAWDFPHDAWPMRDGVLDLTQRGEFDVEGLLAEVERNPAPWNGVSAATRIGHMHLHVSDLDAARTFYHQVLGFDVVIDWSAHGALFVSAGGYHHHIGLNVWNGVGAPPPPPDAAGMRYFSVVLPSIEDRQRLAARLEAAQIGFMQTDDGLLTRDPAGNGVLLTVAAA